MRALFSQTTARYTYHRVQNACTLCVIPPPYCPPRFPASVSRAIKVQKKVIDKTHIEIINHLSKLIAKIYISLIAM